MGWGDLIKGMSGRLAAVGNSPLSLKLGDMTRLHKLADEVCAAQDAVRDAQDYANGLKGKLLARMQEMGVTRLERGDRGDLKITVTKTKDKSKKALVAHLGKETADALWESLPEKVSKRLSVPAKREYEPEPGDEIPYADDTERFGGPFLTEDEQPA